MAVLHETTTTRMLHTGIYPRKGDRVFFLRFATEHVDVVIPGDPVVVESAAHASTLVVTFRGGSSYIVSGETTLTWEQR